MDLIQKLPLNMSPIRTDLHSNGIICEEKNSGNIFLYMPEGCAYKLQKAEKNGKDRDMQRKDLTAALSAEQVVKIRVEDADIMRV